MRKTLNLALVGFLVLGLLACEQRTDRTDSGGVILTFGQIEWSALHSASVSAALGAASIETVEIISIVADPTGPSSALMDVELSSFEVTYRRNDTGTVEPPPLVASLTGAVPVGGTLTIEGMPFVLASQLQNPPLSDLLAINGGIDRETGANYVLLDVSIVFFGRTLSGDEIQTAPLRQIVEFVN